MNETDEFSYEEGLADADTKTILGQSGPWRRDDVMRILLEQPAAADHVCRRLYRGFVGEDGEPDDALIEPLATEFRASNYDIGHVIGIMLRSRHFFSSAAYRRRVKSPVEFCVGTLRQLAPPRTVNLLTLVAICCEQQGQILFDPPSVKGWDGGIAWLNSATTLARMNWVVTLLNGNEQAGLSAFDPARWAADNAIEPDRTFESISSLLLQNDMNPATAELANSLAAANSTPAIGAGLQVLMQSPEYALA